MAETTYLICTDLDNTLLTPEKNITLATKEMMDHVIQNGNYFVYNTGRPYHGGIEYIQLLPQTMPAIFLNGALIIWTNPKTLEVEKKISFPLNLTLLHELLEEIMPYLDGGLIYAFEYLYVYHKNKLPFWLVHDNEYITLKRLTAKTKFIDEPLSASFQVKEEHVQEFLFIIQKEKYQEFSFYSWGNFDHIYSFEVIKKGVSKGAALSLLKDILRLPSLYTIAFGDNYNDVSMLEIADEGIYMCNSKEDLLKKGKLFTSLTSSQDGLLDYLKEHHPELF